METTLIKVEHSLKENGIDFTVYPVIDKYIESETWRNDIAEMLEKLAKRMRDGEYPFKRK